MKALDLAWSDLENGIYFAFERSGTVDRLADDEEIARTAVEAPSDTRAYPRSRLIREFGGRRDAILDWHEVVAARRNGKRAVVRLPDPGAGLQVHGDLDGLTETELMEKLGMVVEREVWRWDVASPYVTGHWKMQYHE